MGLSRRALLRGLGIVGLTTVVPAGGLAGYVWASSGRGNRGQVRFEQPLWIPPAAQTYRDPDGRVRVDLRVQVGRTQLLPGHVATTWGVNGGHLGPTVRVRRGDTLAPRVRNDLPEPTTLHWHGMELPGACDGGPHQVIEPGATWEPVWTVDQPSATLWYHPHPHGATKEHVYRGVAGLLIVDDEAGHELLPTEYGVDDVPVVIQDKRFTDAGDLDFGGISFGGIDIVGLLGSEILVNGTWGPVLTVHSERVRLRVLNASNARVYDLVLDDGRAFHVVAGDAGLLATPVETDHVQLSPGERAEVLISVAPGERLMLRSRPPDLGGNFLYERLAGGDDEFDVLAVQAAQTLRASPPVQAALPAPPSPGPPAPGRPERLIELGDFLINGRTMDMGRIDELVPLGSTEVWRIHNTVDIPHNFHIHNAGFEVLDIDGRPPEPWMRGRKDTVYARPGSQMRLLVQFGQYAGTEPPYMFHCHLLAHEDANMMGQFALVEPGTDRHSHGHH